jgi:phage terminase large subunit-like protein
MSTLPPIDVLEAARALKDCKLATYYPDTGKFARSKYPKHVEFITAQKVHSEILFCAANRIGKTDVGCYSLAAHVTGDYPKWWKGRKFDPTVDGQIKAWACGTTSKTVRDILQDKLLGPKSGGREPGFISRARLIHTSPKIGTPDAVETAYIRHVSGMTSELAFRSYDQGRQSFEGVSQHVILCDEEPPFDCYIEMMIRLTTTDGLMLLTMTPLQGLTDLVLRFMPEQTLETPMPQAV